MGNLKIYYQSFVIFYRFSFAVIVATFHIKITLWPKDIINNFGCNILDILKKMCLGTFNVARAIKTLEVSVEKLYFGVNTFEFVQFLTSLFERLVIEQIWKLFSRLGSAEVLLLRF